MNKSIYLGLSILKITKIVMYVFWYDYVNPNYRKKKQNYVIWIHTALYFVQSKTENIYVNIAKYVETRFDTSNYELDRPLAKVEYRKK